MKITIQHYDKTISFEQADDTDMNGTLEAIKGLMMCMGFHPQSVDQAISCETTWFPEESFEELEQADDIDHPFLQKTKDN